MRISELCVEFGGCEVCSLPINAPKHGDLANYARGLPICQLGLGASPSQQSNPGNLWAGSCMLPTHERLHERCMEALQAVWSSSRQCSFPFTTLLLCWLVRFHSVCTAVLAEKSTPCLRMSHLDVRSTTEVISNVSLLFSYGSFFDL